MPPRFVFVVCQQGAESCCKEEINANHPGLKLAFSRPGFVTFKDDTESLGERFQLRSTFARTFGLSIGSRKAASMSELAGTLVDATSTCAARRLHVWQRDSQVPGTGGFEPGPTALALEAALAIERKRMERGLPSIPINRVARADELVLDTILVEPDYWFWGFHYADAKCQRWPGGTPVFDIRQEVVSRAYFKLHEALLWSGIRIRAGDVCAEIGSSPGGSCQLLLEFGAEVIAIDPAELHPSVAEHPRLTHLKCRGTEVCRKLLKDVCWLTCDVNLPPEYTLEMISDFASNQHLRKLRGIVLTLKIPDWGLAAEIPRWRERVKQLGFLWVRTRQLAFNRQEICLVAVRDRYALRTLARSGDRGEQKPRV
jgi:23S rRNA (cytidine2498-2'-O)-methyltransferase